MKPLLTLPLILILGFLLESCTPTPQAETKIESPVIEKTDPTNEDSESDDELPDEMPKTKTQQLSDLVITKVKYRKKPLVQSDVEPPKEIPGVEYGFSIKVKNTGAGDFVGDLVFTSNFASGDDDEKRYWTSFRQKRNLQFPDQTKAQIRAGQEKTYQVQKTLFEGVDQKTILITVNPEICLHVPNAVKKIFEPGRLDPYRPIPEKDFSNNSYFLELYH